ncbi:unnamed protein product [Mytilus edulis]|uniref:Uncharacterized protein n=1 Tax=Mytilus edulis TaxID=6550 RepID=A0A8S3PP70_MYTED|nr:unnamed protein product [Mytilus edulis]
MDLKTPFKNGIPGKDWWKGFKNRHPEVVIRKPEKLSTVRSRMLNATVVGNYFKELQTVTEELSPTSIWNMDETGINLEHQPAGVLATMFGPLMKEYGYLCTEYMSSDPNNIVNKESAPKLIRQAYEKAFTRVNIVSGFESTGIYHWNPLAIPKEAFSPSDAFDRNNNGQSKTDEHPLQWVLANIQSVPNNPIPVVSLPTDVTPIAQPENVQQNLEVVVEIHRSAVPSSVHTVAENQGQDGEYTVDFKAE